MALGIREFDAKRILRLFDSTLASHCVQITRETNLEELPGIHPWLLTEQLVLKPDVLIKRRGKHGLVHLDLSWHDARTIVKSNLNKSVNIGPLTGNLTHYIVEPFVPHSFTANPEGDYNEVYVAFRPTRFGDEILFHPKGGVEVGNVDKEARSIMVPIREDGVAATIQFGDLLSDLKSPTRISALQQFLQRLYNAFVALHFSFLEINPLATNVNNEFCVLDVAAKLDHTADFLCETTWGGPVEFPGPFGRSLTEAESHIRHLDSQSGASLKLTVLNPQGRIWTMIAGGGASVVYADTICDLGMASELANYGEYSGAPSEMMTYDYARTILQLVTADGSYRDEGKILLIGGGIANFTSIPDTFKGIVKALKEFQYKLHDFNVRLYVRRGGPNYEDGLRYMRDTGKDLDLFMRVYGPETYITDIIPMALQDDIIFAPGPCDPSDTTGIGALSPGTRRAAISARYADTAQLPPMLIEKTTSFKLNRMASNADKNKGAISQRPANVGVEPHEGGATSISRTPSSQSESVCTSPSLPPACKAPNRQISSTLQSFGSRGSSCDGDGQYRSKGGPKLSEQSKHQTSNDTTGGIPRLLGKDTRCFVWGQQARAVQEMLDFDHVCGRKLPSVAAIIYEYSVSHLRPFYFGTEEVFVPVCQSLKEAVEKFPQVDTLINFASMRSADSVTRQALASDNIKLVTVIAEGVPERRARELIGLSRRLGKTVLGPATVGGLRSGCFRIGNTGGRLENIMNAKLYRSGSVGFVTKSGGMLNELNNILSVTTNGTCEGVAIGGDRFPGTTLLDHLVRYESDPQVQLLVMLGEVGGTLEYEVGRALQDGSIKKPLVAWSVGTCATAFSTEVSFGHAGAWAGSDSEHAAEKNRFLEKSGAIVPKSFQDLGRAIEVVFKGLVKKGALVLSEEPEVPRVPLDYAWAKRLGLVRKPKGFVSTISDDRGEEVVYAGWPISKVVETNMGVGGVLALLWFKRPLPDFCYRYLETILMLTADHGPAVCGAHNTIVTARAGKDLISALISGLCTIGDRFGGACDQAAQQFLSAYERGLTAEDFVREMKSSGQLIMGVGHKIKSVRNPDMRVQLLKQFCLKHFRTAELIQFAYAVEAVTTRKKDTLILNVDGLIGVSMCDMLLSCGAFTEAEAKDYIRCGCINGLFVLGRSIGFIGHYLDQKRLKQGLYRHDADDIAYVLPDLTETSRGGTIEERLG